MRPIPLSPAHKPYFLVLSTLMASNPGGLSPVLHEHLDYLGRLHKLGKVYMGGPFQDLNGRSDGNGMYLLRVDSSEEAEEIVSKDPFHAKGIRQAKILIWQEKTDF